MPLPFYELSIMFTASTNFNYGLVKSHGNASKSILKEQLIFYFISKELYSEALKSIQNKQLIVLLFLLSVLVYLNNNESL